jgi:guanyl-specific ribonuclease Sa
MRATVVVTVALLAVGWWQQREAVEPAPTSTFDGGPAAPDLAPASGHPHFLPPEAVATLEAIDRGGPFPYDRDGTVFQNREGRLPARPRGYYREYTVETPGSPDRGARRIVTGGAPPEVYYYTSDHYRSFRRIEVQR